MWRGWRQGGGATGHNANRRWTVVNARSTFSTSLNGTTEPSVRVVPEWQKPGSVRTLVEESSCRWGNVGRTVSPYRSARPRLAGRRGMVEYRGSHVCSRLNAVRRWINAEKGITVQTKFNVPARNVLSVCEPWKRQVWQWLKRVVESMVTAAGTVGVVVGRQAAQVSLRDDGVRWRGRLLPVASVSTTRGGVTMRLRPNSTFRLGIIGLQQE